jgi:HD-GYP domain-containing protein (c-di-GMP phosphodiesterase class II)
MVKPKAGLESPARWRLVPARPVARVRRNAALAAAAALVAGMGVAMAALAAWPPLDAALVVPLQHFYLVSAVSLLAAVMACLLAIATVQIGLYRVLFLALGFASMGGLFAVHGLTTPGILVPNLFGRHAGSAVGLSAFLSLAVPAVFFAVTYLPGFSALERRLPFWPAGWLVALLVVGVSAYGAVSIGRTEAIAELPLSTPPLSDAIAAGSTLLLLFAGARQWRSYRVARLGTQAALATAFVLLAEAQVAMVVFPVWSAGWWLYHLLMLAGVALALRALAIERLAGRSLRSIWEAALELEVRVGVEEIDVDAVAALVAAVEVKDRETQGHNRRVAELAVRIGRQLGMKALELRVLARAGLLHDVGKLGIPDAILQKPGALDAAEWEAIRAHPEIGTRILNRTGRFKRELLAVLYHHERMDGSGYPHGLSGEAIPIEARIVAVADTYDVLTSDRPYRRARSQEEAVRVLREEAGPHLDPRVVDALLAGSGLEAPEKAAVSPARGTTRLEPV